MRTRHSVLMRVMEEKPENAQNNIGGMLPNDFQEATTVPQYLRPPFWHGTQCRQASPS